MHRPAWMRRSTLIRSLIASIIANVGPNLECSDRRRLVENVWWEMTCGTGSGSGKTVHGQSGEVAQR
jgi:hypothetical protein